MNVMCVVVRREVVTEKLRQRLDLERRALKVVERLLDDSVAEDFLVDCVRFTRVQCFSMKELQD